MKVHGSCHCGNIAFEAEVDPNACGVCHCTDCQKLCGSAFRVNVQAAAVTFKMLKGQPRIYIKTAESGNRRAHGFCGECGTPIYAAAPQNTPTYSIRIGTLDERAQFKPRRQIWRRSAMPWAMNIEALPASEQQ